MYKKINKQLKNYNVAVSLLLFLMIVVIQGCDQGTQSDGGATLMFKLPADAINAEPTIGASAITGKPDNISSIIISVTTGDGELLGSGDILLAGGNIAIPVPAHIPLVVIGTGYAGNQALFRGRSNVEAMRPGQQARVSFSLDEITAGNGIVQGTVRDAESNAPIANALITVYDVGQTQITTTTTDDNGAYTLTLPPNENYTLVFSGEGHLVATYANIPIIADETNILEPILQVANGSSGLGGLAGQIVDATTGVGLSGASVVLRSNINAQTGAIVADVVTDSEGRYNFDMTLAAGNYTCEISSGGYISIFKNVVIIGGQIQANQNASISTVPVSGATRIVLTWNEAPRDLDSHLTGPKSDNATELFHVYFGDQGSAIASPFSNLDIDDTDSFGPETTTIVQQFQGGYKYAVHDYSNRGETTSEALGISGAKVEVYQENQLVRTFNVPAGVGVLWTVFEMNGDRITPINTINNDPVPDVPADTVGGGL